MTPPPDKHVSDWTIRDLFNNGGYQKRLSEGEYDVKRRKKPASEKYRKLYGQDTLSVKTEAFDKKTGVKIFKTHHFESPAGEILHCDVVTGIVTPTGKLDPKRLLHDGVLYHYDETIKDEKIDK